MDNDRMFVVEDIQVSEDAGSDVLDPEDRYGKLTDFADWLYGNSTQPFEPDAIKIRLAPSIIARSESELLGISSPRFAFRAYLGAHGFVSIRRRRCIERHIVSAHGNSEYGLELMEYAADEKCNWIADCLLAVPDRLHGFSILTCDLSNDYGEETLELLPLVPFVTHADFGGGLCAQAACFMALCLSPCQQILGISEITSEAMRHKSIDDPIEDPQAFRIRGLSAFRINTFFNSCKRHGIGSQLQHCPLNANNSTQRICTAVRTYLMNRMPVLQLVSLARMLGINLPTEEPFAPVIECTDQSTDYDRPFRIPVGFDLPVSDVESERASHCVLIVGCSAERFVINDPATFPFLQCSEEQLVAICAYDRMLEVEGASYDLGDVPLEPVVARKADLPQTQFAQSARTAPSLFVAIAVTDSDVVVPLLDPGREPVVSQGNESVRVGLFSAINGTLYRGNISGLKSFDPSKLPCNLGEIYLARLDEAGRLTSPRGGLPADFSCSELVASGKLHQGKYWVHHLQVIERGTPQLEQSQVTITPEVLDSLWLWDACQNATAYKSFRAVFVRVGSEWKMRELA